MTVPVQSPAEAALWRRRFAAYAALRLSGLAIFLAGVAVAFSGLVRDGGWRAPGAAIALLGLALATIPPALMKKGWKRDSQ